MFIIPLHLGFEISFWSIPSLHCPGIVLCIVSSIGQNLSTRFSSLHIKKPAPSEVRQTFCPPGFRLCRLFPAAYVSQPLCFQYEAVTPLLCDFKGTALNCLSFIILSMCLSVAFAMLSLDFYKPVLSLFWVPLLFWFSLLFWGSLFFFSSLFFGFSVLWGSLFFCSSLFFGFSVLWGSLLFRLLFLSSRDAPGDVRTHPSDPCRDPSCKDGRLLS